MLADITFTTLTKDLCEPVAELLELVFYDMPTTDQYSATELEDIVEMFPAGTIIALHNDKVVGMGTGIFLSVDYHNLPATENELLYQNRKSAHTPDGDYYYGSDMAVHPDYQGNGIARAIYNRRKGVVITHNKKGFLAVAVLPGYAKYKHEIDIYSYLVKVERGEVFDPTLSVQLRNGFKLIEPIKDFFVYPRSDNWGAVILWDNPNHTA